MHVSERDELRRRYDLTCDNKGQTRGLDLVDIAPQARNDVVDLASDQSADAEQDN